MGKVAQLPVIDRVEHFGEEAQVIGLLGDNFVEIVEAAVSLAGIYKVPHQPKAQQGERPLPLPAQPVIRFFGEVSPDQRTFG